MLFVEVGRAGFSKRRENESNWVQWAARDCEGQDAEQAVPGVHGLRSPHPNFTTCKQGFGHQGRRLGQWGGCRVLFLPAHPPIRPKVVENEYHVPEKAGHTAQGATYNQGLHLASSIPSWT